jgi:hypothetical protein
VTPPLGVPVLSYVHKLSSSASASTHVAQRLCVLEGFDIRVLHTEHAGYLCVVLVFEVSVGVGVGVGGTRTPSLHHLQVELES